MAIPNRSGRRRKRYRSDVSILRTSEEVASLAIAARVDRNGAKNLARSGAERKGSEARRGCSGPPSPDSPSPLTTTRCLHLHHTNTMAPPPSLAVNNLAAQALPPLTRIDPRSPAALQAISPPRKQIHSDEDLLKWKNSKAYADVVLFAGRLGEAAVGQETRWPRAGAGAGEDSSFAGGEVSRRNKGVEAVIRLLQTLLRWTEEIEPKQTPQRFGNLAFRDWGARLEEVRKGDL